MAPDPETDTITAELADALADMTRAVFAAGSVDATLQRVAVLATETVAGCDLAGILLAGDDTASTAWTDTRVRDLDVWQAERKEGPCFDAASTGASVYAEDLANDGRWPAFAAIAAGHGIRSVLALPLPTERTAAALNAYSLTPAFDALDRARGLILATLAGHAFQSAQTRQEGQQHSEDLNRALVTRGIIGQAQGILMERERITAERAFDMLRRASQHLNLKLRDIAQEVVDTGEKPRAGEPPPLSNS